MPRDKQGVNVETSPHPDGLKEGLMNDNMGAEMGVVSGPTNELIQEKNPYPITPKTDPQMKEFEELMRGNVKKD